MATPDLLRLYELYRQMYGGAGSPPRPSWPNAETNPKYPRQTYTQPPELPRTGGEYAPADEVLPSPAGRSQWGQYSAPVVGAPIGLGVPMPVGPFGFGRFGGLPIPFGPPKITEIPMPHFPELPIPESVRGALLAGAVLAPWAARRQMQGGGSTQEPNDRLSPQHPLAQPPNGGGSSSVGILGLLAEAARRWQSAPNDDEQRLSEQRDPNFRELRRVEVTGAKKPKVDSPPLVPDDALPYPESKTGAAPEAGGGGSGGGEGGDGNDEECAKEWADARKECKEALADGRAGQGPFSGRRGARWSVEDCAKGRVRAICGGEPLKRSRSFEAIRNGNNANVRKIRRQGRDQ